MYTYVGIGIATSYAQALLAKASADQCLTPETPGSIRAWGRSEKRQLACTAQVGQVAAPILHQSTLPSLRKCLRNSSRSHGTVLESAMGYHTEASGRIPLGTPPTASSADPPIFCHPLAPTSQLCTPTCYPLVAPRGLPI